MDVRRVPAGAGAARRLMAEYMDEIERRLGGPFDHARYPDPAPAELEPPRGLLLVAFDGEDPVACGAVRVIGPRVAEIKRMYVAPRARGHGLGRTLLGELERGADAIELYRTGIRHCPNEPLMHYNLAVALEDLERHEEAIRAYEACLALSPGLADAHYNVARLHGLLGHSTQAIRHYNAYRRLQR